MPIASKLVYFQRRPSPAPPDDPGPEPPDPRRQPCRDHRRRRSSLFSHHKPGQEHIPGHQRDAATKPLGSVGNIGEHAAGMSSSTRLHRSISDHGRLPDAVQQARERLLQRLNSVDLSGRRQKTWPSESFWAGLTRPADAGVSTSSDNILGSLTNCFQPGEPVAASKAEEGTVITNTDECMPITVFPKPVSELQEAEDGEAVGGASPAECSICLERCGDSGDGLIQLRCRHIFHSACLERWLRSRADCPYCRATVRVCS
ncbi:probable E3 ubiquitin-protein ligase RHY1A [Miscanthus floridulus]|uniref:probable E3 ubiquitin-protein ligase RHY1A n=1 Tax=Miscanthus floridulus TaxID=154761 RepID=UPI003457A6EC